MLDLVEYKGEEIILTRNKHKIARITPGSPHLTALEAMADLYRTLPDDVGSVWAAALERLKKKPTLIINEETGTVCGRLAAALKNSGRGHRFRIQDLWLASLAVQNGFPVLARNPKNFMDIPGLKVLTL